VNEQIFKDRTRRLALEVIKVPGSLPHTRAADVSGKQTVRSATSMGANYRAAADMIAKLAIVQEESDKALYWLELLQEAKIISADPLAIG
jgi:four helix bundle protein